MQKAPIVPTMSFYSKRKILDHILYAAVLLDPFNLEEFWVFLCCKTLTFLKSAGQILCGTFLNSHQTLYSYLKLSLSAKVLLKPEIFWMWFKCVGGWRGGGGKACSYIPSSLRKIKWNLHWETYKIVAKIKQLPLKSKSFLLRELRTWDTQKTCAQQEGTSLPSPKV